MEDFNEADKYDSNSSEQRKFGLKLLQLLEIEKGSKVLDLGCGTGYLTKVLADHVGPEGKVIAIDPDLERLKVAREKYAADNIEYLEGSGTNIPDGDYDIIFCNYVLHWCKDQDAVFKHVHQHLKQGGKFGFTASTKYDSSLTLEMVSSEFVAAVKKRTSYITFEDYKQLASTNNFGIVFVDEHQILWKFHNVHKMIEFLMLHMRGDFDETHFNVSAMKSHYGEGEFTIPSPGCTVVVSKT